MSRQLFIVNVHSFVDLITNSSSELFVARTNKSLDQVKAILLRLVELQQEKNDLMNYPDADRSHLTAGRKEELFDQYFGEIEVCQYDFRVEECPHYNEYLEFNSRDFYCTDNHPVYLRCKAEWDRVCRANQWKDAPASYAEIWADWNKLQEDALLKVLKWAFKKNGLPWTYDPNENDTSTSAFWTTARPFTDSLGWGYDLVKGNIHIRSQDDNSIPYEMFNDIENILNAHRLHLG